MPAMLDAIHQPHFQLLLRLVLGGLLLLAGLTKLRDRPAFYEAVADYDILPSSFQRPFAGLLPLFELSLGVLLLVGLGTRVAAALATPLFLTFALAIAINMARGRHFDCHCFGSVQREGIGWTSLMRALLLAGAALTVAAGASRFGAIELALFGSDGKLPTAGEVIPVVLLAAVVFDVLFLLPETLVFRSGFAKARAGRALHAQSRTARTQA